MTKTKRFERNISHREAIELSQIETAEDNLYLEKEQKNIDGLNNSNIRIDFLKKLANIRGREEVTDDVILEIGRNGGQNYTEEIKKLLSVEFENFIELQIFFLENLEYIKENIHDEYFIEKKLEQLLFTDFKICRIFLEKVQEVEKIIRSYSLKDILDNIFSAASNVFMEHVKEIYDVCPNYIENKLTDILQEDSAYIFICNVSNFRENIFLSGEYLNVIKSNLETYGIFHMIASIKDYSSMRNVLSWIPKEERKEMFTISKDSIYIDEDNKTYEVINDENAGQEIESLMEQELYVTVANFLECLDLLEITVNVELKNKVINAKENEIRKREESSEHRELYSEIIVEQELMEFYINEWTNIELEIFLREQENIGAKKEFCFSDKIRLGDIKRTMDEKVDKIFNWMQVYIIKAVYSEMIHSPTIIKLERTIKNIDDFIQTATVEELKKFLLQAAIDLDYYLSGEYGGSKWVKIVQVAMETLEKDLTLNRKKVLIDRTFQLEHNNGNVFEKVPKNIIISKDTFIDEVVLMDERLNKLLGIKTHALSLDDLCMKFRETVEDHNLIIEYIDNRLKFVTDLKKHARPYGGE
jgi:hypothetical protein